MATRKPPFIACCEMCLPPGEMRAAAVRAVEHNPANAPPRGVLSAVFGSAAAANIDAPEFIAVMTSKYWGPKGHQFGVSFLDNPTAACRAKIISHMNAWNTQCNVSFAESSQGEVRIARGNSGYWSYLGTDILSIPANQPTMNLQGFTESTPDSEYKRVVRHETGHTLGCPHEHLRSAIVNLLDPNKTIAYFQATQGWTRQDVINQVLTPVSESSIMGSPTTDQDSVMCYQLPGSITVSGKPIVGGVDITPNDYAWMSKLYPKATVPPVPPVTPPPGNSDALVAALLKDFATAGYVLQK